jgi:hypothetical protein
MAPPAIVRLTVAPRRDIVKGGRLVDAARSALHRDAIKQQLLFWGV